MLIDYNYKVYLSGITFSGVTFGFTPPFKNNKGFIYSPAVNDNYQDSDEITGRAYLQKIVFMDSNGNDVEFDVDLDSSIFYSGSVVDYYAQFMPNSTNLRFNNLRIGLFTSTDANTIFMPIKYKKMIFGLSSLAQVEPVTWLDTIKLFTLY
jgi:hypothetical protein